MATPPPQSPTGPPPQWYTPSPAPRQSPANIIGFALIAIGFIVFIVGSPIAAVAGGFAEPIIIAMLGFGIIIAGGILVGVEGMTHRKPLPPPPPIQRPPTAPGGEGRPLELACPNCGAAPRSIDRFGVATCEYCGTRFLVR